MLRIEPQEWYMHHAFEIAVCKGITIYDALFIAPRPLVRVQPL